MTKRLLVIMPVINLWEQYTKWALQSLKCSEPWDFLLIDNGSTDGTHEHVHTFRESAHAGFADMVTVLRNEQNKGVSGSWNQGIKYGLEHGYTHFLILNNDILVHPHAIDGMLKRMDHGGVALVAAVDISGESRAPTEIFNMPDKEPSESPHPNFSCFMITKDTIETVGWFDEVFFPGYFEDNSYHYRVKLIRGDNAAITTTTAMFYHFGSKTQNQDIGKPIVPGPQFEKNRTEFIKLWGGNPGQEQFKHPYNDATLYPYLQEDQTYRKLA